MAEIATYKDVEAKKYTMETIDGEWYGVYHYLGRQQDNPRTPSTRFRAAFSLVGGGNKVTGKITDESFAGEAEIEGSFIGRSLKFTKKYKAPQLPKGMSVAPVFYEGTLSDDGATLSGIWLIKQRVLGIFPTISVYGTWEAYRRPFE